MYVSEYKYWLVRDQILHKAPRASWNLITWPTGIYIKMTPYFFSTILAGVFYSDGQIVLGWFGDLVSQYIME
jgi:hypothetical protein